MRQSQKLIYNAFSNLIGSISRLLAVFLLPPFVISYIGTENYGLIVIATTVMSFINLIQVGTPNALSRFLSEALAREDYKEACGILSTGGAILTFGGILAMVFTLMVAMLPDWFLTIPAGTSTSNVRFIVLIMGGLAAIALPLSLGNVIFYVKGRFGLLNALQIAGTVLRIVLVIGLVWNFKSGVAYVAGNAIASLSSMLAILIIGLSLFKEVKLALKYINKATIKKILGYGIEVFIYNSLYLFYIQGDYLIIGKTISPSAVTMFNLAVVWGIALRGIIVAVVSVAAPSASGQNAKGNMRSLQIMLIRITKYALTACLPAVLFLIIFRNRLIMNWMGEGYEEAARLLIPILVGEAFVIAEAGGTQIYLGIGKLRFLTVTNIIFGGFNVLLTVIACTMFNVGLLGVAVIYMVLLLIRSGLLTPVYMSRELRIPVFTYYHESYFRPLLAAVAIAPFIYLMYYISPFFGWIGLFLTACMIVLIYLPLAYMIAMDSYDRDILSQIIKRFCSVSKRAIIK